MLYAARSLTKRCRVLGLVVNATEPALETTATGKPASGAESVAPYFSV